MTILYGTGFEAGSKEIVPSADVLNYADFLVNATSPVHSGNYRAVIRDFATADNWVRFGNFAAGYTELYASVWLDQAGTTKGWSMEFELTDNTLIGVRKEQGIPNQNLHAYVDGSNVQTGTITLDNDDYVLLELYVKIAASGGRIVAIYNGTVDINYTGNTKATSATDIQYLRFGLQISGNDSYRIDDLTISDDGYPGDIRYKIFVPDGDSAITWTPNAGGANYIRIDERPPSDADYVETAVNANQDLYTVTDYDVNNAIAAVVQWVRGFTTPAGGEITMQIESGATTSEETSSGLGTSAEYISRVLDQDPNTAAAWTITAFDAILAGQEAVVTAETVRVTQHMIEVGYAQTQTILIRPLGLDVGLETGSRVWVTTWEDDVLFLKKLNSNLVLLNTFSFGAATEAQVDARTFYLSPYAPGFFGTSGLSDIIYVYGRWDDGAVTHLEKSTDGGATFTDIGDSATWLTGWVGAFMADDANTLYAFVNGGSPALYRSIDAGATWTNLSSLPFDVDPGGVSKHPDGRILIINRDSGPAMAGYAEPPNYDVWFDATGSPSFPTGGGGANAVIWIT